MAHKIGGLQVIIMGSGLLSNRFFVPVVLVALTWVIIAAVRPDVNRNNFAASQYAVADQHDAEFRMLSKENSDDCIPVTVVRTSREVFLPVIFGGSGGQPPQDTPIIGDVSEDTDGCLKFVGDVIHFSLDAGEVGGTATIDIGDIQTGIALYDDGTGGDTIANDGVYERDYIATSTDIVRSVRVTGYFRSLTGQVAIPVNAPGTVTITNWEAGELSVDPVVSNVIDPVTGDIYADSRMVIGFVNGTSFEEVQNILVANHLTLASWLPELFVFEVELDQGQDYDVIRQQLLALSAIEEVEHNYAMDILGPPVTLVDGLMPVDQANYLNPIRARLGWSITKGSASIKIATTDTGVDEDHPDLIDQIDVYYSCPICSTDDPHGHGTFIAGIIAAEQGTTGISGVAPGVRLFVFKQEIVNQVTTAVDLILATRNGARVINLSLGNKHPYTLNRAVEYAYERNVVIIAAVGEDAGGGQEFIKEDQPGNHKLYPASFTEVLAVGSTEVDDTISQYSDYGDQVLYAPVPLWGIMSTDRLGGYRRDSGTSYASPQVAALAALILSVDPSLSNDAVVNIITQSADDMPGEPGLGRINVYRALKVASGQPDPGPDPLPATVSALQATAEGFVTPYVRLTWTPPGSDYAGVHIYRRETGRNDIQQLEGGLITGSGYEDHHVVEGSQYTYFVFAVDATGQESVGYEEVEMVAGTIPATSRVSVASDGTQGNDSANAPAISADGRYVAFDSTASNLVPGDSNNAGDIFVHDRQTGQISRVSVASDGTQANSNSELPAISADGRYVAFHSGASNLVPNDTNGANDVFVHDRQTGQTSRISVASDGTQANMDSYGPSISADGRYVAFDSTASNLVPGDSNGYRDVFVHDRQTGQTSRISVASDGTQGNSYSELPSISADGRYVAFPSWADTLVPGDSNSERDIFVHDRQTGQTSRISVASDGTQGNGWSYGPSISADGRYVAFDSSAGNLAPGDTNGANDVFVHDRQTGQTSRLSVASDGTQANSNSRFPCISADGRYVVFDSSAGNLVSGDTNNAFDVFIHDRQTEQTSRVSVASDGTQGNDGSWVSSISADGRYVAFESSAGNLVPGDTNNAWDIFVHDRGEQ